MEALPQPRLFTAQTCQLIGGIDRHSVSSRHREAHVLISSGHAVRRGFISILSALTWAQFHISPCVIWVVLLLSCFSGRSSYDIEWNGKLIENFKQQEFGRNAILAFIWRNWETSVTVPGNLAEIWTKCSLNANITGCLYAYRFSIRYLRRTKWLL